MNRILIGVLAAMLVLPVAAGARAAEPAAKANAGAEPVSWKTAEMIKETAVVETIDHTTRMVTLKASDGEKFTFKAGKNIQQLEKVKAGDEVKFAYYESLSVRVLKKGEAGSAAGEAGLVTRATTGEKPAGFAMREKTILATIEAIDNKAKTATLKLEDGKSVTVSPRDPKRLDLVKVGDRLEITHSEEVAVKVEKVEKKK